MSAMTVEQAIHLAVQHHQAGRLAEAEPLYRQVLAAQPNYPDALNLLGLVLHETGRNDQALQWVGRAIDLAPATAEFHYNLGVVLAALKRHDQAIAAFKEALRLKPDHSAAYSSMGHALKAKDRWPEAFASFRRAVELKPEDFDIRYSWASALAEAGHWQEAIDGYRWCLAERPDFADAHLSLGILLLRQGDFRGGWEEYEWRWKVPKLVFSPLKVSLPIWDGTDLGGKRILIHCEQGFGDTIQFIRLAPRVAERGGKVVVYAPADLLRLLRGTAGVQELIGWNETNLSFDAHCPLMSLPEVLGVDLTNIPGQVPYLFADAELAEKWKSRVGSDRGLKVGLAWAGRPSHLHDTRRSLKLNQLSPLAKTGNARFFSLQKGPAGAEVRSSKMKVLDYTAELGDFADTAALIANLDLVISVDSAVAHLAGAMGKPVWTLLPYAPDWRWLLDRQDSPWYPTMRLFRQKKMLEWDAPIAEAAAAMGNL